MLHLFYSLAYNVLAQEQENFTLLIDPGHGGTDNGATKEKLNEKEIVLNVANYIKENNSNLNIYLTRKKDENVNLLDRANIINEIKPDLAISLHINTTDNDKANGFEIFTSKETESPAVLQFSKILTENLTNSTELNPRGELKKANFAIIRKSEVPTIMLEIGFMSNDKDLEYISSKEGQMKIAEAIIKSAEQFKTL